MESMEASGYRVRLPGYGGAKVSRRKLRDYLLEHSHPVGGAKALFFARLGFSRARWRLFEVELRRLIRSCPAWAMPPDRHGQKFLVRGTIRGPWRREARVVSVWIVRSPGGVPDLVTVYPWKR